MARPSHLIRIVAGASLLALAMGMPTTLAQSVETAAEEALGGLRGTTSDATSPETSADDLGDPGSYGEPAPLGDGETGSPSVQDGDIDTALEPPAEPAAEPVDPDLTQPADADLSADGMPDAIAEAPEEEAPPATEPTVAGPPPILPASGRTIQIVDPADLDPSATAPEPGADEPVDPAAADAAEPPAEPSDDGAGPPAVEPSFRPAYEEEDPYAPIGIRAGSFILYPSVTFEQRFDDNVLRAETGAISDRAIAILPALRVVSDWSRHSLEADVSGVASTYQKFDSEDERALDANLRGRVDVTSDTLIDGALGYRLSQESRGTIDFPADAADRPDVTGKTASLALTQRFNRLTLRLRGAVADSDRSGDGLDDSEDYLEKALGLRAAYEVSPGLHFFVEHERSRRTYGAASAADGLLRDADGHVTRAGVAAQITAKLVGELSAGKLVERPDADALAPIEGLVADGSLTWTPSALTTVNLGFRSAIAPTAIAGSAGALERGADVEVRHEFRRWFAAIAGLDYTVRDYAGTAIEEDELTGRFGLEYLIGREWVLGAEYARTEFWSSEAGGDYSDNLFRVTGTLRQ